MRRKGRRRTFDLTGPDRCCPFAFDDDADVPSMSLGDSSVSDISAPASIPPPASGTPSAERGRFRQEVRSSMQFLFASSAAPGPVRTYEAMLRAFFSQTNGEAELARVTDGCGKRALRLFRSSGPPWAKVPVGSYGATCSTLELR